MPVFGREKGLMQERYLVFLAGTSDSYVVAADFRAEVSDDEPFDLTQESLDLYYGFNAFSDNISMMALKSILHSGVMLVNTKEKMDLKWFYGEGEKDNNVYMLLSNVSMGEKSPIMEERGATQPVMVNLTTVESPLVFKILSERVEKFAWEYL